MSSRLLLGAWCLGHDIVGTKDAGGANRYYTKYDNSDTSIIFMPLLWDFDMAERTTNAWSQCHTVHFPKLFNNNNRTFVDEYVWHWRNVGDSLYSNMLSFLNGFYSSPEGQAMDASVAMEEMLQGWSFSLAIVVSDRLQWYQKRAKWLKTKIDALNPKGDVNIDSRVSISDVTALIDMLLSGDVLYPHAADVNGDGNVTIADVTAIIDILLAGGN